MAGIAKPLQGRIERAIDQETWRAITALAVIRKRYVHVLDREPEDEEVRFLLDGVERILRRTRRSYHPR